MKSHLHSNRQQLDREAFERIFDFQWKAVTAVTELIAKGVGVYFFLLLATIGAIFRSNIKGTELQVAVMALVAVTILFGPIMIFMTWGIVRGIDDLEITLRRISPRHFEESGIDQFFRRGRLTARVAAGCCIAILAVIAVTVASIQFR